MSTIQIGSVGKKAIIAKFYLVSNTATAGSDAANNWTFQPKKNNAVNMTASPQTTDGNEIVQDAEYDLGAILASAAGAAATDTLQVEITKNGTPTDLSNARIVFGWNGRVDLA